jgi:putative membrane protein
VGGRPSGPWDSGLQIERTTLAWLRTTLAFVVGMLVLVRLIGHENTVVAAICAALTLPLGITISWLVWHRHLHSERRLFAKAPLPGGLLPAAVSALSVLAGFSGLIYVLLI